MSLKKDLQRAHKALLKKGFIHVFSGPKRENYTKTENLKEEIDGFVVVKTTEYYAAIVLNEMGVVVVEDDGEWEVYRPDPNKTYLPESLKGDDRFLVIDEDEYHLDAVCRLTFVNDDRIFCKDRSYTYTKAAPNQYGHVDYGDWLGD